MEIDDDESHPTVIAALGPLFKLTEVYLWDEGFSEIRRGFSLPKHIVFKYDDEDNEDDRGDGKSNLNLDVDTADGQVLVEDVGVVIEEGTDIVQQMSTLGLPLSFLTNKDKNGGAKRGKRNGILRSCNSEKIQDEALQSSKLNEKEDYLNEGSNNAEKINVDDMITGDHVCDESFISLQTNDGTTSQDFGSCIITDQPQLVGVAESSDTVVHDQDDSYCNGSFGDWSAVWDSYYTRNYFYNSKTYESTWDPPPGMEHLAHGNTTNESSADLVDLTISSNDSQLACKNSEGDCEPCSLMDIPEQILDLSVEINQNSSNGICNSKIDNEEDLEASAGEVDNEATPAPTKRKKKSKKSRSQKKSLSRKQEQHFQCSVDAYCGGIGKYWCQRYRLFSRFDEGIKMDEEGWFSVTPEAIAKHQASRCGTGVIIDCFTGSGGNAIQFAKTGRHVIAVDIDPKKIEYAKHNAAIYGVEDQIDFVIGDSFSLAAKMDADTVFMSPPWGGPEYSRVKIYDMGMLKPHDGQFLFDTFKETASMIVMFLPRNVDVNQLAEMCLSAGGLWSVEVEKNFLNDKLKAVTAYFFKVSVLYV